MTAQGQKLHFIDFFRQCCLNATHGLTVGPGQSDERASEKEKHLTTKLDRNSENQSVGQISSWPAHKLRPCPLRSDNDHFGAGAANNAKSQQRRCPSTTERARRQPYRKVIDAPISPAKMAMQIVKITMGLPRHALKRAR